MKRSRLLGAVCAWLVIPISTNASTLISDSFQRTGTSEQISVPFIDDNGVLTVNAYSGHVEVIASGTGNSLGTATSDAFYGVDSGNQPCVTGGVQIQSSCDFVPTYQLGASSEYSTFTNSGASDTHNFITFIDSVGYISPGTVPDYNSLNHTYHFIMDLSLLNVSSSSLLTFGVTDDHYPDNGGTYLIDIYQVQAVPIPATAWLFGSGLLELIGVARKKAST